MGLPLHHCPNGSAGDSLLDDARLVHRSMGLPLHKQPDDSVVDPLLNDVQLVHGLNGLSLDQFIDPVLDDAQFVHESNGLPLLTPGSDPVLDDARPVHGPNGLTLHQHSNESVIDLVPDDAQSEERDPHVLPTFTAASVTEPRFTILYLPPLLSSLPKDLSVPPVFVDRPPLVTKTHLPNIDTVSLSLHKALHHFRPLSEDYAGLPYADAFNWLELELPEDEEREWYTVAFRSRRKKGSDSDPLYDADRQAHEEAVTNGGLLMYWYGVPNPETGMNLATCIWQSRKHAIAANSRPHHIRAMKLAAVSYEIYNLERYKLSKVKGDKGVFVEDFSGDDCGW